MKKGTQLKGESLMFKKPEEVRISKAESEEYGQQIDAKNAQFENVEHIVENNYVENEIQEPQTSAKLNEEEIKQRVGEQNFKNAKAGDSMNSVNS